MSLKKYSLLLIAPFALYMGCKKNDPIRTAESTDLSNKTFIKVYNATLSSTPVNISIDGVKQTGAIVSYAGLFPASTTYSAQTPGNRTINILDTNSVHRIDQTITGNFEQGKYYTVFMYDTITSPKTKLVMDSIVIPSDTVARVRMANFFHASPGNIDVYSTRVGGNIFANVAPFEVTPFINHPSKRSDTLFVRAVNTTTNLATLIFTPGEKRNYTLLTRGRYSATTGTAIRTFTLMTNY